MRYSELAGKEVVSLDEGVRLGVIADSELVIDVRAGRVAALILPQRAGWLRPASPLFVPWEGIRKIGRDLIIVDLRAGRGQLHRFRDLEG